MPCVARINCKGFTADLNMLKEKNMCLFKYKNLSVDGKAYQYGIKYFECGACPECLQKKSRRWALRCGMESKVSEGMMITLTYDTYKLDNNGKFTNEENPVDTSITVNKKHCQDFMKRLRARYPDKKIKYLLTAEYGKRTHRAHYHALIFGLRFTDLIQYKKSKRGNIIYKSKTLEKIWKHGICTVDCINLSAKTARYCTKYCAKDAGIDDTFMLFSRGIGEKELLKQFDGKSYWIDGREYPIPRQIWEKVITNKYKIYGYAKYCPFPKLEEEKSVDIYRFKICKMFAQRKKNEIYRIIRDNDSQYKVYIKYWSEKATTYEKYQPEPFLRILALPDNKYRSYKVKALKCLEKQVMNLSYVPPRSNCLAIVKRKTRERYGKKAYLFDGSTFGVRPRHYTPNDRNSVFEFLINGKKVKLYDLSSNYWIKNPFEN